MRQPDIANNIANNIANKHYIHYIRVILAHAPTHSCVLTAADGVEVSRSPSRSIWAMLLFHLELRPEYRYRPNKVILAALYIGKHHPAPGLILRDVIPQLDDLHRYGVRTECGVRFPSVIWFSGDLQAKVLMMQIVSWSGYWSCMWCEIPGSHQGGRMRFDAASAAAGPRRTSASVLAQAAQACLSGAAVCGI